MKKFLMATLLVTATSGAFAQNKPSKAAVPSAKEATASDEITVGVKGMVCAFCAQGIEKNFKAEKEVSDVKVSLENKYVKIKFKEGQRLSNEKIASILKDAGYEASFSEK